MVDLTKEPIRRTRLGDCDVVILGTAHISQASVESVEALIDQEKPDTVCVELCNSRMRSIKDPEYWKKLDIFTVFKERKMYLLLSSLILSSFQKKLGFGKMKPGDEMRKAIEISERDNLKLIPVDREIQTTLKRAWGNVGLFSKSYLISALAASLLVKEEVTEEKIEAMKTDDALKEIFSQLPGRFDQVKRIIIDERDEYLAEKIRRSALDGSKKVVAVVGAGHLEGIMKYIGDARDLVPLELLPVSNWRDKLSIFILPGLLVGMAALTFYTSGMQATVELVTSWFIVKSSLSALGAIIALAQPGSRLVHLDLDYAGGPFQLTDVAMEALCRCRQLQTLGLGSNRAVTIAGVAQVLRACPHMTKVRLCGASGMTQDEVQALRREHPLVSLTR